MNIILSFFQFNMRKTDTKIILFLEVSGSAIFRSFDVTMVKKRYRSLRGISQLFFIIVTYKKTDKKQYYAHIS